MEPDADVCLRRQQAAAFRGVRPETARPPDCLSLWSRDPAPKEKRRQEIAYQQFRLHRQLTTDGRNDSAVESGAREQFDQLVRASENGRRIISSSGPGVALDFGGDGRYPGVPANIPPSAHQGTATGPQHPVHFAQRLQRTTSNDSAGKGSAMASPSCH